MNDKGLLRKTPWRGCGKQVQSVKRALLDAEVRMGEILKETEHRGKGGSHPGGSSFPLPKGITKNQSAQFQALAKHTDIVEKVKAEAPGERLKKAGQMIKAIIKSLLYEPPLRAFLGRGGAFKAKRLFCVVGLLPQ